MRILYFTQLFYPLLFGGGEYLFFLLARELVKRGNDVDVVTQAVPGAPRFEEYQGIRIHRVGSGVLYRGTLPPTIKANLDYVIRSIQVGRRLITQGRKEGHPVQIIHSNTYSPVLSGHICARLYNIPDLVTFHDVYQASNAMFWAEWMARLKGDFPAYTSIIAKILERQIMRLNVGSFHTVSEASKEDLIRFGVNPALIVVIPNGIDPSDYDDIKSGSESNAQAKAVFVGRLVFYKNLETVIRAFRKVIEAVPDARLEVLGDGPNKESLILEAKPLGSAVHFAGRVSQEEKIKIIKDSSFMVFPSLLEGFGISMIEAFACRKPVLASDVRPLSDIILDGQDGFVTSPFDVDAWSRKMTELFENPSKARKMGDAAYEHFLSKYQIPLVATRIENLYRNVSHKSLTS